MKRIQGLWYLCLAVIILNGGGCASVQTVEHPEDEKVAVIPLSGIYHKVKPGQTIWRIAKVYGVSIDDIIKGNNIPNVAKVEENQLLFIPGATEAKDVPVPEISDGDFSWPVKGKVIGFFYNDFDQRLNKGICIQAPEGTTVKSARSGKVVFADQLVGYGKTVIIDHEDGFHSVYGQNAKLFVKQGDYVVKNNAIAEVGRSGEHSYEYFEIRKNSQADNPLFYLP